MPDVELKSLAGLLATVVNLILTRSSAIVTFCQIKLSLTGISYHVEPFV